MTVEEAIKKCQEEADVFAGSECGLDHAQLASWLQDYKRLKEQQPAVKHAKPEYFMFACEMNLCLGEINVPKSFLHAALQKMVEKMKTLDKNSSDFKELSYYTQILHGAVKMMDASLDIVAGLALIMSKDINI